MGNLASQAIFFHNWVVYDRIYPDQQKKQLAGRVLGQLTVHRWLIIKKVIEMLSQREFFIKQDETLQMWCYYIITSYLKISGTSDKIWLRSRKVISGRSANWLNTKTLPARVDLFTILCIFSPSIRICNKNSWLDRSWLKIKLLDEKQACFGTKEGTKRGNPASQQIFFHIWVDAS